MNLFKRLKTYFLFKNSPKKNKDVTYGSELEIYNSEITYTNRYQNFNIPSNDFETKGVKFLSNIIIEISLNPDTIYCKEYFKFLNMLSIGSIRYTHIRDKGVMLLYISGNVFDYESLVCANIESSNILIETIVRLLETLPSMGFSRIMTKNIIPEHRFSYDNNYNYDDNLPVDPLKPYKDFKTAINRFDPEKIAEIIEIDHLEYAMSKYKEIPATRLANIIFISNKYINIDGYTLTIERKDGNKIFVYSMRIDDFIIEMESYLTIFTNQSSDVFCKLMDIINDENIGNYFNIERSKNKANIFNITSIDLTTKIDDYTEDQEYDESEESFDDQYQSFYDGVDEVLSEEDIREAEEYAAKINSKK